MNIGCDKTCEPAAPTIRAIIDKNWCVLNNIEDGVKAIGYAMYGEDKFLNDDRKQCDIPGSIQSDLMKLTAKLSYIESLLEEIVRGLA